MTDQSGSNGKPLRSNVMGVIYHPGSLNIFIGTINEEISRGRFSHKCSPIEGGTGNQPPAVALRREFAEEIGPVAPQNVIFVAAFRQTLAYPFLNQHALYGGKDTAVGFYLATHALVQSIDLDPKLTDEAPAFQKFEWSNPRKARELLKDGADHPRRTFIEQVANGMDEVWYALRLSLGVKPADLITRRNTSLAMVVNRAQKILKTMSNGYTTDEASMPVPRNQTPLDLTASRPRTELYKAASHHIRRFW